MISILHIVLSTVTGGMENVIYNLATAYDKSKFNLKVGCLHELGALSTKMEGHGVESKLVPGMIPGVSMIYPRRLIEFIRRSKCDIVHTHSGCWPKVAAACSRIGNVKLVYTEHGRTHPDPRLTVFLDALAARATDRVVAVSEPLRKYLISRVGVPENKIMTINNGIDTERFRPSNDGVAVRRELGYSDNEVVIGIVARLAPVKNHRYLIDAFRLVAQKAPQARLLIIGDGPLRTSLQDFTAAYDLDDRVTFLGDRMDVPRLLTGVDISVLSSQSEGISLTLLEAMSSGLPVVATAVGGNPDIIQDRKNGLLVDTDNVPAFADSLSTLVESSELRSKMGQRGREHVVANWSLRAMNKKYEELYEQLLR